MNLTEMVDRVRRAGGIDIDEGLAQSWINDRYQTMCVRSRYSKQRVKIGETVLDQSDYDIPDDVEEILELTIGSVPFARTGLQTRLSVEGLQVGVTGTGGFFSPEFDEAGVHQVAIFPIPAEPGLDIAAYCVVAPPPLTPNQTPIIPIDFHRYLVEGAVADGLAFLDENLQASDRYEARFDDAVERLRKRVNSKVGNGPYFVQLEGVHYRR